MKLYKHCSYNANSLSILINRKLWYCKPIDFNDPFDGDFELDPRCTLKDYIKIFNIDVSPEEYDSLKEGVLGSRGRLKKEILEEEEKFIKVFKNIGVLSLTPHRDNVLMWSHYSDEHRGFSIGFEIDDETPVTTVNYQDALPKHHLSYFHNITGNQDYIPIQFTKHSNWKYEDESRISVNRGNRLIDFPGDIFEINFGCKMNEIHKETISRLVGHLAEHENISLYSAVKSNNLSLSFEHYEKTPNE